MAISQQTRDRLYGLELLLKDGRAEDVLEKFWAGEIDLSEPRCVYAVSEASRFTEHVEVGLLVTKAAAKLHKTAGHYACYAVNLGNDYDRGARMATLFTKVKQRATFAELALDVLGLTRGDLPEKVLALEIASEFDIILLTWAYGLLNPTAVRERLDEVLARKELPNLPLARANIEGSFGDVETALSTAEQAATDSPKDPRPRLNVGFVMTEMGDSEKAVKMLESWRADFGHLPEFQITLLGCLVGCNRTREAMAIAEALAEAHPTVPRVLDTVEWVRSEHAPREPFFSKVRRAFHLAKTPSGHDELKRKIAQVVRQSS